MNQFTPDNNLKVGPLECNLYQLVYIHSKSTANKYQSSEIKNEGSPSFINDPYSSFNYYNTNSIQIKHLSGVFVF